MPGKTQIKLLVIDEDQTFANQIVTLIESKMFDVELFMIDEKVELEKSLRKGVDVALIGKGFDLDHTTTLQVISNNGYDVPLLALVDPEITKEQIIQILSEGVAQICMRAEPVRTSMALIREFEHLVNRREYRKVKNLLEDSDHRNQMLLRQLKSPVAFIKEGVHLFANQSYLEVFGHDNVRELLGTPVIDLIAGRDTAEFKERLKDVAKGNFTDEELKLKINSAAGVVKAMLQVAPASFEGESCLQLIVQPDNMGAVTGKIPTINNELDSLTGLGNRTKFEAELKKYRTGALKQHLQHGLMFISIDNIGHVNSAFGIEGSDALITHVANRMKEAFPKAEMSRFGDSTYTAIIPSVKQDELLEKAEAFRDKIDKDLVPIGNKSARTSVSIGMCLINETSPDTAEIFKRAYAGIERVRKKTKGEGNAVTVYDPIQDATNSKAALFETVNNALDRNQFALLFQATYDVNSDTSNLHEVYLRLPLPDGTVMTPDQFLDVAEQAGMLERLDRWVMLNAAKSLRRKLKEDKDSRLLINLSGNALQDKGLPEFAGKLVQAIGAKRTPIIVQFSESDVNQYLGLAKQQLAAFKEAGCGVSINNFGASMKAFEVFDYVSPDILKLDRSYVSEINNPESFDATSQFITQIKSHGAQALIAFVEDAATMSKAWTIGADFLQGHYLQSPVNETALQSE